MNATGNRLDLPHHQSREHLDFIHALEDMDEDSRAQLKRIMQVPHSVSPARHIWDVMENAGAAAFGEAERVELLEFIRDRPVKAYSYPVSARLTRGARPSAEKLTDLFEHNGFQATINLCSERPHGDLPLLVPAGLVGKMKTEHIPIVDGESPKIWQVLQLLHFLANDDNVPAYIHCEQGVGRTGVMTACYRMATMGWSLEDAWAEADRFGCKIPMQEKFVRHFGHRLNDAALARNAPPTADTEASILDPYPTEQMGSHQPTDAEKAADVQSFLDPV